MRIQCTIVITLYLATTVPLARGDDPQQQAKDLKNELPRIPATEPVEAIRTFRLPQGVRMELVAAEPLIVDPIDMVFDEAGRIFVIEMRDYPFGPRDGEPPQGRVRLLEDSHGDGRIDRSYVFADKLAWPTALAPWDGGVFVACAPDILYLKDTDGDRVADRREVVFSGFGRQNVQALLNNIKWGLDNWFYGASGGNGGEIRSSLWPDSTSVKLGARDFRFRPTGEFEPLSGGGQFGHSMDDFGRRFVCSNSNQARHVVLEDRYLSRNPLLPVPSVIQSIASDGDSGPVFRISPPEPWRVVRTRLRVAAQVPGPIEHGGQVTGYFTSATGITVYRDTALGDEYYGNLFIGEVANNLVHRKRLMPRGVTFQADRADEAREFIASTDIWFRPVNFANGPDGALYICDMYREVVEHPLSIPDVIKQHLDLTSGKDRGRIWRVVAEEAGAYQRPQLASANSAELVQALGRRDAWWRETAARLLFQRQDRTAVPFLEQLTGDERPETRAAALWALDGLGALPADLVERALGDSSPDVREQAIRLSEPRLPSAPELSHRLRDLADDSSPRVRLQLAYTLGELEDQAVAEPLARLAERDGRDPWMRAAILSSVGYSHAAAAGGTSRALALLRALVGDPSRLSHVSTELESQLVLLIGVRNQPDEIHAALDWISTLPSLEEERQWALLRGLADGRRRAGQNPQRLLNTSLDDPSGSVARRLDEIRERAVLAALDEQRAENHRIVAIELLAYDEPARGLRALPALLSPRQSQPIQMAAVRSLSELNDPRVAALLLAPWKTYSPPVRREATEGLFRRTERLAVLLDEIESGQVRRSDLERDRRKQLLSHQDLAIRQCAEKLLGDDQSGDRHAVIALYQPMLAQAGNAEAGKSLFQKHCTTCHKLGGEGHEVGPDLVTVRERTAEALLDQILDPNREINPAYINYILATSDGRVLTGLIASESATSVTLKRAEGITDTVLRAQIDQFVSTGLSLMPEGLEKEISPEQMADLIAFLRQGTGNRKEPPP